MSLTRIGTNVSAIIAQHNLAQTHTDLQTRLERLSTGLRINRGADDPSGLIVSERLRNEISGVHQAVDNAERASNVIATSEAALAEVSSLLTDMKGLIVEAANTGAFSRAELEANQLQIDSAIESITRIAQTTSFAGLKLLNGSLDYLTSGVDSSEIQDVQIFGANFGSGSSLPVTVEVLNSAQGAQLFLSGNTTGAAGALLSSVSFELQGNAGVQVLEFVSGTALSAVAFAVNQAKDITGVSASLVNAADATSGLVLTSLELGSDSFVSVRKLSKGDFFQTYDTLNAIGPSTPRAVNRDTGQDVLSLVNGSLALGNGAEVSLRSASLNIKMNLTRAAAQSASTYSFSITGGGTVFQVGSRINAAERINFGIQSVTATNLGSEASGFLNSVTTGGENSLVAGSAQNASDIVDAAIDQVATLRGRLGAFERNTLQTSARSNQIALENLTSAESVIRDADFAAETAALTRAQILANAGTSTLAIANTASQSVLSLLQ